MALSSREFLRKRPSYDEANAIIQDLAKHGDVAMVILAASYLEGGLEDVLAHRFVPMDAEDRKKLFDASAGGVLGTLVAKVRIARAFGIIDQVVSDDLLLIANLRNVFAHSMHTISFDDSQVKSDCEKLKVLGTPAIRLGSDFSEILISEPRDRFKHTFMSLHLLLRFLRGDQSLNFVLVLADGTKIHAGPKASPETPS